MKKWFGLYTWEVEVNSLKGFFFSIQMFNIPFQAIENIFFVVEEFFLVFIQHFCELFFVIFNSIKLCL